MMDYTHVPGCLLLLAGFLQRRSQGFGQLVGTAGGLPAALDALKPLNGLLRGHSGHQAGDALQVAVAASGKNHGADHAIFQLQIDFGGTDAGRRIGICHLTSLLYIGFMDVSAREGW